MIPSYYLYLQKKLIDKFPKHFYIKYPDAITCVVKQHATKELAKIILKEMENDGLIKLDMCSNDLSKVILTNVSRCRLLEKPNKVYRMVGFW